MSNAGCPLRPGRCLHTLDRGEPPQGDDSFKKWVADALGDAPPADEPVRDREAQRPRAEPEDVGERRTERPIGDDRRTEAHRREKRKELLEDEDPRAYIDRGPS